VSIQAMDRKEDRSPDVERAAERLARLPARVALTLKRLGDVFLAFAMLVALLPVFVVVVLLLAFAGDGMIERRVRLGRHGRAIVLRRFHELPGGNFGRTLERIGARELPLLLAVLRGRLSFVGPRALPPGTAAGHTGPRRLLAPGLTGPAQRGLADGEDPEALRLDDAYVAEWTLWNDARLLAGRSPKHAHQSVSKSSS
jgi:lipopolysaccharide/colanic/teichoic acid biosynthesis glycosyltransferase